jgi:hypothetical protein
VEIGLVIFGRIEVDHTGNPFYVDASSRDVGGHQGLSATGREVLQCPISLILGSATVQGDGGDPSPLQLLGETVGAVTGPGEDDRRAGRSHHFSGVGHPIGPVDHPKHVLYVVDRVLLEIGLVSNSIPLVALGEDCDVTVESCREENRLPCWRGHLEEAAHGGQEAHVGHAVGLVDHDYIDIPEVDITLVDQVFEAAGAGDEKVNALMELATLRGVTDTPVDRGHGAIGRLRKRAKLGSDLFCEFPGWSEDEPARTAGLPPTDSGDQGQAEGEGLPGAGGSPSTDVTPGENVGNGEGLDGKR